jgi:hypothetical protein
MAIGGSEMNHAAIASRSVPKPPRKPKRGIPSKLHVILPGELVELVDRYADKLSTERPFEGRRTRTDAMKALLIDALKSHGLIK